MNWHVPIDDTHHWKYMISFSRARALNKEEMKRPYAAMLLITVGVILLAKPGKRVERREPLVEIHHRDGRGVNAALALCSDAVTIEDEAQPPHPVILGDVR